MNFMVEQGMITKAQAEANRRSFTNFLNVLDGDMMNIDRQICPTCNGMGTHDGRQDVSSLECPKCNGTGVIEIKEGEKHEN